MWCLSRIYLYIHDIMLGSQYCSLTSWQKHNHTLTDKKILKATESACKTACIRFTLHSLGLKTYHAMCIRMGIQVWMDTSQNKSGDIFTVVWQSSAKISQVNFPLNIYTHNLKLWTFHMTAKYLDYEFPNNRFVVALNIFIDTVVWHLLCMQC